MGEPAQARTPVGPDWLCDHGQASSPLRVFISSSITRRVGSAWIISEAPMEARPGLAHPDLVLCPGSSSDCMPLGKSPHHSVLAVSIVMGSDGRGACLMEWVATQVRVLWK